MSKVLCLDPLEGSRDELARMRLKDHFPVYRLVYFPILPFGTYFEYNGEFYRKVGVAIGRDVVLQKDREFSRDDRLYVTNDVFENMVDGMIRSQLNEYQDAVTEVTQEFVT